MAKKTVPGAAPSAEPLTRIDQARSAVIIDIEKARAARKASAARPFQARLLAAVARRMDCDALAVFRKAVRVGVAEQRTTQDIVAQVMRDQVRQKARAAL